MEHAQYRDRGKTIKESGAMRGTRYPWAAGLIFAVAAMIAVVGCFHTPTDTSEFAQGPAPKRMPSPTKEEEGCGCYEDSLTGGQIFKMYCSYCHNSPAL